MPLRLSSSNAELVIKGHDTKTRLEANTADIYSKLSGNMQDTKKSLPDGITNVVKFAPGETSRVFSILKNYSGSPKLGREQLLGTGIDQELKELKVFANQVSKVFTGERWGYDAHEKEYLKLLEKIQPQGSKYMSEIRGMYAREALLERYASNLLVAPTSQTKRWNENILFKNLSLSSQPAYSNTNATYETNISNAGTTAGATADWDQDFLDAMISWAIEKNIEPMDDGMYVVTCPSRQAIALRRSLRDTYKDSNYAEASKNAFTGYLGDYANKLKIYEDFRSPVVGDSAGNITAYYKGAGDTDDRISASGTLYDVGFLHGKGALTKAYYEDVHWEIEETEFRKYLEWCVTEGCGYQRTVFDNIGNESASSALNNSSIALFARRQTIVS